MKKIGKKDTKTEKLIGVYLLRGWEILQDLYRHNVRENCIDWSGNYRVYVSITRIPCSLMIILSFRERQRKKS